jgi:CheY-like chemotaxis protein
MKVESAIAYFRPVYCCQFCSKSLINNEWVAVPEDQAFGIVSHTVCSECQSLHVNWDTSDTADLDSDAGMNGTSNVRMLVVDDCPVQRKIMTNLMKKENVSCVEATGGEQATTLLLKDQEKFDIIFLDLVMPGLNGFDTIKLLRDNEVETPVIALTGLEKDFCYEEVMKNGFTDFCSKPVTKTEILNKLNKFLKAKGEV